MTIEQWAGMAGFLVPALVAVVNREEWKPWVKAVIALLSSIVVGTVTALLSGDFTGTDWATAIGIAFAASQVAYMTWWKGSGITTWIEDNINVISGKQSPPEAPELGGTPGDSAPVGGRHARRD